MLRECWRRLGLGLPIVGKLLGHTPASTTQRYALLDTDPLRRASNAIAGILATAIGHPSGAPQSPAGASASAAGEARADNVVTFRPGQRR